MPIIFSSSVVITLRKIGHKVEAMDIPSVFLENSLVKLKTVLIHKSKIGFYLHCRKSEVFWKFAWEKYRVFQFKIMS